MHISIEALSNSVYRRLGPLAGASLGGVIAALANAEPDGLLSTEDAAAMLAVALIPVIPSGRPSLELPLSAVHVAFGAPGVTLTPAEALDHLVLKDWLAPSWPLYLAKLLKLETASQYDSPLAPRPGLIETNEADGYVWATATLEWPSAAATIVFGVAPPTAGVICSAKFASQLIRDVGAELGASTELNAIIPARAPAPFAFSATIH